MGEYRVLLADDQELFVNSLRIVFESRADDIRVVGIAANGLQAVEMTSRENPDVILMDVRMPVMDGVVATARIHALHPEVRIVMLTTYGDDDYVRSAIQNGAVGYLLKNMRPGELIAAVRAAKWGTIQISPQVANSLILRESNRAIAAQRRDEQPSDDVEALLSDLTSREREVLELLIKAYENRQIAETLGISMQTAKNHIHAVYEKLYVSNRLELIRLVAGMKLQKK